MQTVRATAMPVRERIRLLALAAAGAVCGHAVTYALCLPDVPLRNSVLRQTGHAYWHGAVAGAFVGALWFAILHTCERAHAGRDGGADVGAMGFTRMARQLGALQLLIFVAIEIAERLEVGRGLTSLTAHNVLAVGVVVQAAVAALLALAAWALGCAAHAVGHAFATAITPPRRRISNWVLPQLLAPAAVTFASFGGRGPPSLP